MKNKVQILRSCERQVLRQHGMHWLSFFTNSQSSKGLLLMGSLVSSPTLSINQESWNPGVTVQDKSKFNMNLHPLCPPGARNCTQAWRASVLRNNCIGVRWSTTGSQTLTFLWSWDGSTQSYLTISNRRHSGSKRKPLQIQFQESRGCYSTACHCDNIKRGGVYFSSCFPRFEAVCAQPAHFGAVTKSALPCIDTKLLTTRQPGSRGERGQDLRILLDVSVRGKPPTV